MLTDSLTHSHAHTDARTEKGKQLKKSHILVKVNDLLGFFTWFQLLLAMVPTCDALMYFSEKAAPCFSCLFQGSL